MVLNVRRNFKHFHPFSTCGHRGDSWRRFPGQSGTLDTREGIICESTPLCFMVACLHWRQVKLKFTKYDFQDSRVLYQTMVTWFRLSLGFAIQESCAGLQSVLLPSSSRLAQCLESAEGDSSTRKIFWPRFFLQIYFDKQGSWKTFLRLLQTLEPQEVKAMQ